MYYKNPYLASNHVSSFVKFPILSSDCDTVNSKGINMKNFDDNAIKIIYLPSRDKVIIIKQDRYTINTSEFMDYVVLHVSISLERVKR